MTTRLFTLLALGLTLMVPPAAAAQPASDLVDVEVEPITCWWRSSTSAVRSGEQFMLTLTCQVVDAEKGRVVPDLSKLAPAVVELQPFEVIGGRQAPDMRVPGSRFFQYEYELRLINEGAFGADVDVPELKIGYRIESQVASGNTVQGRDLTYNLRPISIRLLSIVPEDTMDIREAPAAAFLAVEAREARAANLRLFGSVLMGLAGVVLLVMLVNLARRRVAKTVATTWQVTPYAVASAVRRELNAVKTDSRGGWDAALVGRALSAARLATSLVIGGAIGQVKAAGSDTAPLEGQLLVKGPLGRGGALVSAGVTPRTLQDAVLNDTITTFTRARYARTEAFDEIALNAALEQVMITARRASVQHSFLGQLWSRLARA